MQSRYSWRLSHRSIHITTTILYNGGIILQLLYNRGRILQVIELPNLIILSPTRNKNIYIHLQLQTKLNNKISTVSAIILRKLNYHYIITNNYTYDQIPPQNYAFIKVHLGARRMKRAKQTWQRKIELPRSNSVCKSR